MVSHRYRGRCRWIITGNGAVDGSVRKLVSEGSGAIGVCLDADRRTNCPQKEIDGLIFRGVRESNFGRISERPNIFTQLAFEVFYNSFIGF